MVTIRAAAMEDKDAALKVLSDSVRELCRDYYNEKQIETWADIPSRQKDELDMSDKIALVAEEINEIIGFTVLHIKKSEVEAVYVSPKYIRRGIGSKLLAELEKNAKKLGLTSLHLFASLNAVDFYKHAGYQALEKTKYRLTDEVQVDCIKMKKEIIKD
jgi:N-acetylglutamate synthase-like GNAT family acetyltransferase